MEDFFFIEGDLELQKVDPERVSSSAVQHRGTRTHTHDALAICDVYDGRSNNARHTGINIYG